MCIQELAARIQKAEIKRADRDQAGRREVQPLADAAQAEQHHAEEAGLEEERRQHLVAEQRPEHRPGAVGEHRPVGAELVGHDDAGDDAHGEGDGEDLQPVAEDVEEDVPLRPQPQPFQHHQEAGQPDGEGGEQEVPHHDEGELEARQVERARQGVRHRMAP